jgi:hypothetical protein
MATGIRLLPYNASTREIVEVLNQALLGKINIVAGANMTVTQNSTNVTLAASGGGGGAAWTEVELDFGSSPVWNKQFTITDASIGATSKVIVVPSGNAPTGLQSDELEMDLIGYGAKAAAGSATVYAAAVTGPVTGKRKVFYSVAT